MDGEDGLSQKGVNRGKVDDKASGNGERSSGRNTQNIAANRDSRVGEAHSLAHLWGGGQPFTEYGLGKLEQVMSLAKVDPRSVSNFYVKDYY